MWLFIYKILTQSIIILSWVRYKIIMKKLTVLILKNRTFTSPPNLTFGYTLMCCDCQLEHRVWIKNGTEYMQPLRPKGYDYSLRKLAPKSDETTERETLT